jgi:hypothetical protein
MNYSKLRNRRITPDIRPIASHFTVLVGMQGGKWKEPAPWFRVFLEKLIITHYQSFREIKVS